MLHSFMKHRFWLLWSIIGEPQQVGGRAHLEPLVVVGAKGEAQLCGTVAILLHLLGAQLLVGSRQHGFMDALRSSRAIWTGSRRTAHGLS